MHISLSIPHGNSMVKGLHWLTDGVKTQCLFQRIYEISVCKLCSGE